MSTHVLDDAAAYALGTLDADEAPAVEAHLQECPTCRLEVRRLREVSGALPLDLEMESPAPGLKARVLEAARAESHEPQAQEQPPSRYEPTVPPQARRRQLGFAVVSGLAAAAVVLFAVGLTVGHLLQPSTSPRGHYEALLASAVSHGDHLVGLEPTSGSKVKGAMSLAVAPSGATSLIVGPTVSPPKGEVYELWYLAGKKAYSVGVFKPTLNEAKSIALSKSANKFNLAAMTVEKGPTGSLKGPTTTPFVVAHLSA